MDCVPYNSTLNMVINSLMYFMPWKLYCKHTKFSKHWKLVCLDKIYRISHCKILKFKKAISNYVTSIKEPFNFQINNLWRNFQPEQGYIKSYIFSIWEEIIYITAILFVITQGSAKQIAWSTFISLRKPNLFQFFFCINCRSI